MFLFNIVIFLLIILEFFNFKKYLLLVFVLDVILILDIDKIEGSVLFLKFRDLILFKFDILNIFDVVCLRKVL